MFNFFKKDENKKPEENNEIQSSDVKNEESEEVKEISQEEKKNIFSIGFDALKKTVSNTSKLLVGDVISSVESEEKFSDFVLDDMEDLLIRADLGVNYAGELVDKLRKQDKIKPSDVKNYLKNEFMTTLTNAGSTKLSYNENELNIYFITGVNGVGKTTLIGKLAYRFK
nr:signal recognition particle receptor subunit alpha [bacterium]